MRNPPEDSGIVKRFSYKESNSSSSDGQNSFQTSYSPTDSASKSKSLLGNSDMDVIWSVRNDGTAARKDMLTALSPPPMKGFYSRYTSQDPRFKSLLDSREKGSKYGQSGGQSQYSYSQKKSSYSYSQERGNQQRYSEPSGTFSRQQPPPHTTTRKKFSHQEYSEKDSHINKEGGNFNSPSPPPSEKGRNSSNSWDDFF